MGKKALVVYFSRAGENFFPGGTRVIEKGNTHVAAEFVAEIADADLFEIKVINEYPAVYKECVARAVAENKADERPELVGDIDITDYEVIYVGYPNWCGTMPMPVWTFLSNHDFAGKEIWPFCTNEGSGLANSVKDIANLAPVATLKEGLSIKGSLVADSKDIIKEWING